MIGKRFLGVFWVYSTSLTDMKNFFDFNFFRELRTLLSRGCSLSCLFIQLNNLMHLIVTRDTGSVSYDMTHIHHTGFHGPLGPCPVGY